VGDLPKSKRLLYQDQHLKGTQIKKVMESGNLVSHKKRMLLTQKKNQTTKIIGRGKRSLEKN